ncbi:hypothetical protein [Streptomyces sp. NPDC002676]
MAHKITRRTALTAASVTTAALLIAAGPASAANHRAGNESAAVTHSVQFADAHDHGVHADARRAWVLGQVYWMRDHQGLSLRGDAHHGLHRQARD